MRIYSIFDDFGKEPIKILKDAGIDIDIQPFGSERPNCNEMKKILEEYDGVIIGTSQKMEKEIFKNIKSPKIIATASVGVDHICIPEQKSELITVLNTPKSNSQSVAEYTIGCALACSKRIIEGRILYSEGKNNKKLLQKPEDIYEKTLGVIGAGNISFKIMEYGKLLGVNIICWTFHPEKHESISKLGVKFVGLDELLQTADIISVNLPDNERTKGLISEKKIQKIKDNAIFISVSRKDTCDYKALIKKAKKCPAFYMCLDLDIIDELVDDTLLIPNVIITPHIAGGTVNTRKKMFKEIAEKIVYFTNRKNK